MKPIVTIVVPCYNEEEVFDMTYTELKRVLTELTDEGLVSSESRLLFVNDGSRDQTWEKITTAFQQDDHVIGIKLSRNSGHQKALLAGLTEAVEFSDCVISIDADLQDDTGVIRDFILKYLEGYDVVYGVRDKRDTDSFFKRNSALAFYRLMEKLGLPLVNNHADYRLLSKRALLALLQFKETHLFLRGIIPLLGFKSTKVFYNRKERAAGESKYPLKKMLSFAFDGITSFSIKPIRIITILGFLSFLISVFAGGSVIVEKILGEPVSGWASLMISVWFIGGLLLISIGLIGEYIGKIYEEVKQRPKYFIEEKLAHLPVQEKLPVKQ